MNCLYITLFFNIVASIVQTFIKSWNQLLYPRVIEVCRQPFEPRHDFFLHLFIAVEHFTSEMCLSSSHFADSQRYHKQQKLVCEFPLDVHLLRWEIEWRNAPRIWRDFGSALPLQTRLTQTQPVLPLSSEHGSPVKDQGRRQCCQNKHKKFPSRPTRDVSLLSGHPSYTRFESRTVHQSLIVMCLYSGRWVEPK